MPSTFRMSLMWRELGFQISKLFFRDSPEISRSFVYIESIYTPILHEIGMVFGGNRCIDILRSIRKYLKVEQIRSETIE